MSNEEIVLEIQNGNRDMILELWENVSRYVYKLCNRYMPTVADKAVSIEDLRQESFCGFMDAVDSFQIDMGTAFITHLKFYVLKSIYEAARFRTARQQRESKVICESLDEPIDKSDDDSTRLSDTIADSHNGIEDVEQQIYTSQLHRDLCDSMSDLPTEQADFLRMKYFDALTAEQLRKVLGLDQARQRSTEAKAIRNIRKSNRAMQKLNGYIEQHSLYSGTGRTAFETYGCSKQERIIMKLFGEE